MRSLLLGLVLAGAMLAEVMTTPKGTRYHTSEKCVGMRAAAKSGKVVRTTETAATAAGKTPCKTASCRRARGGK